MRFRVQQVALHVIAFTVAFCSFVYELLYSELYKTIYGGTVVQYSLTIGIFFASLGIGSYFARHFDDSNQSNFLRVEVYLALVAPIGFLFAILLGFSGIISLPNYVEQVLVRVPIFMIGLLSGFELPILFSMVEEEKTDKTYSGDSIIDSFENTINSVIESVLSIFFYTDDSEEYDTYSSVLAMDYIGSLVGSLIYAFYLYPHIGLGASVFILAFLNCLAAILFISMFNESYCVLPADSQSVITSEQSKVIVLCVLILVGNFAFVLNYQSVNRTISEYHTTEQIEQEYISDDVIDITITEQESTAYQQLTYYNRTWTGESDPMTMPQNGESCLRLDSAIQLCESWANSYHSGLVDVPLSMYDDPSSLDVMIAGGGDWIAVNYLRDKGADVDLVDVDSQFMEIAKDDQLLSKYHEDAYTYENLTVYEQDAYSYLQETNKQYDVILLDLPGAKDDDLLHLYSEEFYTHLNQHLSEDGIVVTWAYDENVYRQHHTTYTNTISNAGFSHWMQYWSYGDFNNDGEIMRGERFYILSPSESTPQMEIDPTNSEYVRTHQTEYSELYWDEIPTYTGVKANKQLQPNYDIIVDTTNPNHGE